jgi:hypothetical protein
VYSLNKTLVALRLADLASVRKVTLKALLNLQIKYYKRLEVLSIRLVICLISYIFIALALETRQALQVIALTTLTLLLIARSTLLR